MKVIIAGGRDFNDYALLENKADEILSEHTEIIIVSGKARGADSLGEKYAKKKNYNVEEYPADWKTYGKRAGPIRNEKMAKVADMLIAFWDGKSSGTRDMIAKANQYGLDVHVVKYEIPMAANLYLSSVSTINKLPEDCKRFLITFRSLQNMDKYGITWLYRLAPSYELLMDIKSKRIEWPQYVKRFRKEMLNMQPVLDKIEETIKNGQPVALICYCHNAKQCHRGILGNYFREVGIDVIEI